MKTAKAEEGVEELPPQTSSVSLSPKKRRCRGGKEENGFFLFLSQHKTLSPSNGGEVCPPMDERGAHFHNGTRTKEVALRHSVKFLSLFVAFFPAAIESDDSQLIPISERGIKKTKSSLSRLSYLRLRRAVAFSGLMRQKDMRFLFRLIFQLQ